MAKPTKRRADKEVTIPTADSPAAIIGTQPIDVIDSDIARRIRAEYLEMPGMSLKAEQVQRLCGLEGTVCKAMLDALVEANFLCLRPDGGYSRLIESVVVGARPLRNVTSRRQRD